MCRQSKLSAGVYLHPNCMIILGIIVYMHSNVIGQLAS